MSNKIKEIAWNVVDGYVIKIDTIIYKDTLYLIKIIM